jgi:hypothetical protein
MTAVREPQLKRVSSAEAAGILADRDPVLGRLIEAAGRFDSPGAPDRISPASWRRSSTSSSRARSWHSC